MSTSISEVGKIPSKGTHDPKTNQRGGIHSPPGALAPSLLFPSNGVWTHGCGGGSDGDRKGSRSGDSDSRDVSSVLGRLSGQ